MTRGLLVALVVTLVSLFFTPLEIHSYFVVVIDRVLHDVHIVRAGRLYQCGVRQQL